MAVRGQLRLQFLVGGHGAVLVHLRLVLELVQNFHKVPEQGLGRYAKLSVEIFPPQTERDVPVGGRGTRGAHLVEDDVAPHGDAERGEREEDCLSEHVVAEGAVERRLRLTAPRFFASYLAHIFHDAT